MNAMLVRNLGLLLVLAAPIGAIKSAAAQTLEVPRPRQGYYIALGTHAAADTTWEKGNTYGPWLGSAFTIRTGQLLTPRLGLGLGIDFGAASGDNETATFFGLAIEGQWEFVRNLALHGGAGLGVSSLQRTDVPNAELRGGVGGSYSLGLSYDWFFYKSRLSGGFSVTPKIQTRFIPGDGLKTVTAFLGIEVAYWTGLPANQLELPESEAYRTDVK